MLISHSHRFVFVHIPKTGGNSVAAALHPFATRGSWEGDCPEKHLTAWQIRQRFFQYHDWNDYFSFAFVRNPWELLHSDYWYCRSQVDRITGNPDRYVRHWAMKVLRVAKMSFSEFVHTHWSRSLCQTFCQCTGEDVVSFIGRFEDLANDFAQVCDSIGLSQPVQLVRQNTTLLAGRPRHDYRLDYTPQLRDVVARRFAYDIDRFGYEF